MLVFIDESGDSGLKIGAGSSQYFVVTLVAFEDNDEATAADRAIDELRKSLGLPSHFEFHFNKCSGEIRQRFLQKLVNFDFSYFAVVVNKQKLYGPGFHFREPFYKYTCNLVFTNAKPHLSEAIVVIDGNGSREFRRQLSTYLKRKINDVSAGRCIRKVKIQDSARNNLLQLADMVCGSVARCFRDREDRHVCRKIITAREVYVQVWPR